MLCSARPRFLRRTEWLEGLTLAHRTQTLAIHRTSKVLYVVTPPPSGIRVPHHLYYQGTTILDRVPDAVYLLLWELVPLAVSS